MIKIEDFEVKKPKELGFDYEDIESFKELLRLHNGRTVLEQKFDGYGCIVDNRGSQARVYSLNKNEWNVDFMPEVRESLKKAKPFFAIGEIVGKPTRKGFTNLEEFAATKARIPTSLSAHAKEVDKESVRQLMRKFPLDLQIYHLLEFEGKDLRQQNLPSMRTDLENLVVGLENIYMVQQDVVTDPAQYQDIVLARFDAKLEGSIAKAVDASYLDKPLVPGTKSEGLRNTNWIKLKCNVTVDLVVLGTYLTEKCAKKGLPMSGILGGVRNGNHYETLIKVPLTNREKGLELAKRLNLVDVRSVQNLFEQNNVVYNQAIKKEKDKIPQKIVSNPDKSLVVEIEAMDISRSENYQSCGLEEGFAYTLRQPIFLQIREDKTPSKATTTQQVQEMYKG